MDKNYVKNKLENLAGNKDAYGGIALSIPELDEILTVSFGDGTNLSDDEYFDDYLYIMRYNNDDAIAHKMRESIISEPEWQVLLYELDGCQLDFNTEEEEYDMDITNAVYDAFQFIYGNIPKFEPLCLYHH